ncbi:MAG: phospho-N-acetylmuramoyl-pentapeptide-transferase [Deltaproteobacteria bacterium]|nr:phospho-N-acetylmuramoyl-pentapeptide-transferase [Deltaproteobacteria bacterium]
MLYHLFTPLADTFTPFNVFRYITFRTAWGMMTALVIGYLVYPPFIAWMQRRRMEQAIRDDGPEAHLETKVGTPTMGGLPMIVSITLAVLLWCRLDQPEVWMALTILVGYGLIGFVDDWRKVARHSSAGLSGRWKLTWQAAIGLVVLGWGYLSGQIEPSLALPFLKGATVHFDVLWAGAPGWLGWVYVGVAVFILLGASNAVNLTDGLDGLAIGPIMTTAVTYGLLAWVAGNHVWADYLQIPYVEGAGELTVVAMAILGAGLGFLWYNAFPALIFMGDVGSLSLGGTLGALAVLTKHEILLVVVGGVFVLEALSVIVQVVSFKTTGKRVFAMAPIHHHYEKRGWAEPKIIVRFWIISLILALVALTTLKLR